MLIYAFKRSKPPSLKLKRILKQLKMDNGRISKCPSLSTMWRCMKWDLMYSQRNEWVRKVQPTRLKALIT